MENEQSAPAVAAPRRGRPKKPVQTVVPITETDEFKSAVAKAAADALSELLPSLKEARRSQGTTDEGSDPTWMRALAMEISQLTDQGTGRRRVAPEVLRARQEARARMTQLIIDARAAKKLATYRVKAKTLLADRVVEPFWIASDHSAQPTIIDWDGIPNEAMVPENKTASAIFDAFMDSIGSSAKVVPEDALAITPGGLVVHGGAASISSGVRQVRAAEQKQTGNAASEQGLNIHHKNEPGRFVEKRILGSIAEPARQTA
jgi:hypothetical protein